MKCFGFLVFVFSRCSKYSWSMHRKARPLEMDPVILFTLLNTPARVFFTKLSAPFLRR